MVVPKLLENFPGVIQNWSLYVEGWYSPNKDVGHSRFIDGKFNKQGN